MATRLAHADRAVTTRQVWDVTEPKPIPRGAVVSVEDYEPCADLYVVDYEGRVYMAEPEELKAWRVSTR